MNIFLVISIINFALLLVFFFYFKWYVKRRISALSMLQEYQKEVNELITEVDAVTDRDLQLIEDRIAKLKNILDTADKRINLYIKELEKSKAGEALYTSLGRGIRSALTVEENSEDLHEPLQTVKPPPPVELPPLSPPAGEEKPPYRPPTKQQLRTQIDLFINEGLPAEEIALRLGISVAEVNLAMNLRRPQS